MRFMSVFPILTGVLELAAGIVYLMHREYLLALAWTCYAIAAISLGLVK